MLAHEPKFQEVTDERVREETFHEFIDELNKKERCERHHPCTLLDLFGAGILLFITEAVVVCLTDPTCCK